MRGGEFQKIFIDSFQQWCSEEIIRRQNSEIETALKVGSLSDLEMKVLKNSQILGRVFSSGLIEKIWSSVKLSETEKHRMFEALLKGMRLHATHNQNIAIELQSTHEFVTAKFDESTSQMTRLRLFRLLEETGLGVPSDIPPGIRT